MKWEAPIPDIMLEFLHTFVIKTTNIYFGYKDKVYVINKQLIIDVFGVYVERYVMDPKRQVGKIVALQALHNYKIEPTNFIRDQWNAKSLGLPYLVRYLAIISMIYQSEKVNYFSKKNAITLMKTNKRKKIDWAQIMINSFCNELD